MTQDFRLPVFFKYFHSPGENGDKNLDSGIKIMFVCEDVSDLIQKKLAQSADLIYNDLK